MSIGLCPSKTAITPRICCKNAALGQSYLSPTRIEILVDRLQPFPPSHPQTRRCGCGVTMATGSWESVTKRICPGQVPSTSHAAFSLWNRQHISSLTAGLRLRSVKVWGRMIFTRLHAETDLPFEPSDEAIQRTHRATGCRELSHRWKRLSCGVRGNDGGMAIIE